MYVAVAFVTILIPLQFHVPVPSCTNSIWHSGIFHAPWQFDHFFGPSHIVLIFDEFTIWELFGILQATLFAILAVFEPELRSRAALVVPFAVMAICFISIFYLGNHKDTYYEITLFVIPTFFLLEDILLYSKLKNPSYASFIWFVDGPLLLTIIATTFIVGIPLADKYKTFFSGAIAFQLMLGNTLVLAIRLRDSLLAFNKDTVPRDLKIPDAVQTDVVGITRTGAIWGSYRDKDQKTHVFMYERGKSTKFDVPDAAMTAATSMTDSGGIIGEFTDTAGERKRFLLENGQLTTFS